MNLRRFLSYSLVAIGAMLFSVGIQAFAAFTQPSTSPPNADADAPLTTGATAQSKAGGLLLNTGGATNGLIVQSGNVGIGTTAPWDKMSIAGSDPSLTFQRGIGGFSNWRIGTDASTASFHFAYNTGLPTFVTNDKVTITSSGNVGIGTAAPSRILQIERTETGGAAIGLGNAIPALRIVNTNNVVDALAEIQFGAIADKVGVAIGYRHQNGSNNTQGDLVFGTRNANTDANLTERMRIKYDGNVGIGTTNPRATLSVGNSDSINLYRYADNALAIQTTLDDQALGTYGGGAASLTIQPLVGNTYIGTGGGGVYKPGGGSFGDSSDERLKTNIVSVSGALDKITQLNPVLFDWINPSSHANATSSGGFIAQQMMRVFPEFITEEPCRGADCTLVGGPGSKEYTLNLPFKFDAYLVGAIKELNAQINDLKAQNKDLKDLVCLDHPSASVCQK